MKVAKSAKKKVVARGASTHVVLSTSIGKLLVEMNKGVQASKGVPGSANYGRVVAEAKELAEKRFRETYRLNERGLKTARRRRKDAAFSRGAKLLQDLESTATTAAIADSAQANLSHNRDRYRALYQSALKR